MRKIYFTAIILLATSFLGCKQQTCTIRCISGTIYFMAVGYTRAELTGSIQTFYTADNSFDHIEDSVIVLSTYIYYPPGDTTSDTLIFAGMTGGDADVILFIPATNQTSKISNLVMSGNLSEQIPCYEGSPTGGNPVGPECSAITYLESYTTNGTMYTEPQTSDPSDTVGYIYIHK